jgi:hypothetical protein
MQTWYFWCSTVSIPLCRRVEATSERLPFVKIYSFSCYWSAVRPRDLTSCAQCRLILQNFIPFLLLWNRNFWAAELDLYSHNEFRSELRFKIGLWLKRYLQRFSSLHCWINFSIRIWLTFWMVQGKQKLWKNLIRFQKSGGICTIFLSRSCAIFARSFYWFVLLCFSIGWKNLRRHS